jgi:hypothetical protein
MHGGAFWIFHAESLAGCVGSMPDKCCFLVGAINNHHRVFAAPFIAFRCGGEACAAQIVDQ